MGRPTENLNWRGHGECAGSITAKPLVAAETFARWVKLKAAIDNAGNVYVGMSNAVTKAAGTDTVTAGFPLDAGQETDWLPVPGHDLANVHIIGDNAGDDVLYQYML